jgi:acyl CoA:acetate/3-ketoacid CoA transferase alpha subunit
MTGGFGAAGHPVELIEALIAGGASDQTSQASRQHAAAFIDYQS